MSDEEILSEIKLKSKEELEYYSNPNKPEREKFVVRLFLSILGVGFMETELNSPEQSSKIDVSFRDAAFQVKELMNENYRRGRDIKKIWKSVENAKTLQEVSLISESYDVPDSVRMIDLVYQEALRRANESKYIKEKGNLDLLFYVTRTRASLIQENEVQVHKFSELGWRSVLCVNEKQAVILSSSALAPRFINNNVVKVFWRHEEDLLSLSGKTS